MSVKQVLVSIPTHPEHREQFLKALPGAEITFERFANLSPEQLARFDAVVGNPGADILPHFKNLKILQLMTSGVAPEYQALKELFPDLIFLSTSGAFGQAISEHMLASLLMLMKRMHEYRDDMKEALWVDRGHVQSPRGMTALIVGAGSIGNDFAHLLKLLGATTIGLRRTPGGPSKDYDQVHTIDKLDELLPTADIVALSLPGTPETHHIMNAHRFGLMKQGSFLLNVGRGTAIDQDALLEALKQGKLGGVSLDVTEPEPLPKDHPLWREKDVLITPHISGFFHLRATHDNIITIACNNLAAFPKGPYQSQVDYDSGYRAK